MTPGSGTVVDARTSLAIFLRAGRAQRNLSLDDVARVTKIQPRILEKLESGQLEGLPAEVFVKGFVRSFARCVGLDETEALDRYGACRNGGQAVRALLETMALAEPARTPVDPVARRLGTAPGISAPAPVEIEASRPAAAAEIASAPELAPAVEPAPESAPEPAVESAPEIISAPVAVAAVDAAPDVVPDAMSTPAPEALAAEPVQGDPADAAASREATSSATTGSSSKKKRSRKRSSTRSRKKRSTASAPVDAAPTADTVTQAAEPAAPAETLAPAETPVAVEEPVAASTAVPAPSMPVDALAAGATDASNETVPATTTDVAVGVEVEAAAADATVVDEPAPEPTGTWRPTMPPLPTHSSMPWRRPPISGATMPIVPSLVIDDADPDSAEREQDERKKAPHERSVSFLPPILLDREDRSARQGGLTLAVIILLIAATLTLSYLMRRPSVSGDGVTMQTGRATPAQLA